MSLPTLCGREMKISRPFFPKRLPIIFFLNSLALFISIFSFHFSITVADLLLSRFLLTAHC